MTDVKIQNEFRAFIEAAYRISEDVGDQVNAVLAAGREAPLTASATSQLLTKVLTVLKASAERRQDETTIDALAGDVKELIKQLGLTQIEGIGAPAHASANGKLELQSRNGIKPGRVQPTPVFHMMDVPMNCG